MAKGVIFSPSDGNRIAEVVRRVERMPLKAGSNIPTARGRWTADVQRAIYTAEYHDFYGLTKWDGTEANRGIGEPIYAWKPALLRPLSALLYTYTVTINGVDSVEVTDGTTTEDWVIRPRLRLNYTDTMVTDAQAIDSALCSAQLASDLAAAGITIDQIVYQDLNIQGRVWAVSQQ